MYITKFAPIQNPGYAIGLIVYFIEILNANYFVNY